MEPSGDFRAVLEARAADAPDAPFLCAPESGQVLTYGALTSTSDALAAHFERLGAPEVARRLHHRS